MFPSPSTSNLQGPKTTPPLSELLLEPEDETLARCSTGWSAAWITTTEGTGGCTVAIATTGGIGGGGGPTSNCTMGAGTITAGGTAKTAGVTTRGTKSPRRIVLLQGATTLCIPPVAQRKCRLCYGRQTDAQCHLGMPNQHAKRDDELILDFELILQFRSRWISLFL